MPADSDSTAGAQPAASGSGAPLASRSSAAEPSLIEAIERLVRRHEETNVHLLVLTDQVAKCLAHVSLLLDLLVSEEEPDDRHDGTYLDGTPIL